MSTFRIWNRVPPSIEWHLSGKCRTRQVLVTWEFAARSRVQRFPSEEQVLISLDEDHELCPRAAWTG
jgi:hypothetical protein